MGAGAGTAYDGWPDGRTRAPETRMDPSSESGQSTVEWLALMAMLVALAGVLVATVPSIGDTIVGAFKDLIRTVGG